jgi:hypothetical protein
MIFLYIASMYVIKPFIMKYSDFLSATYLSNCCSGPGCSKEITCKVSDFFIEDLGGENRIKLKGLWTHPVLGRKCPCDRLDDSSEEITLRFHRGLPRFKNKKIDSKFL